jgi:methyltransferase (TIGR00027 family)
MNHDMPSKTARKVALNILALGEKSEVSGVLPPGIVDATARLLIASGVASDKAVRWFRSSWMVRLYEAFDWMLPGQFEAFAFRKAFCERQVRAGIASGATRVLVLGAGYDTMGWRLAPEFPDVHFFEIDHPATAHLKARGIAQMGPRPNLHLIAKDLSNHPLVDAMADHQNWDASKHAVFVAEGLLQYLSPASARDVFRQCAAVTAEGRIAFTYIPTGQDGQPDAGPWSNLVLWLLEHSGEPWLWSIPPGQLEGFLAASGWANAPELVAQYTRCGVERFAVATK